MGKLNLTRRAFAKLSAATLAAGALATAPQVALAEDAEAPSRGGGVEAGAHLLPRLRQDGVRRVGYRGERPCGEGGGRPVVVPKLRQLLRQVPDVPSRRPIIRLVLYHPLKRTNPKGEEPGWQRISWDEAMDTIGTKFQELITQYGGECIFNMCGTSRQWVYGPYAFYKWLFQTPNAHVASEICKGPRRLMGWISSVRRRSVDGAARWTTGVRAVGHSSRELQLRRLLPQPGGPHERCRDPHLHRPAAFRLWQRSRLLAEPRARHRWRPGAGLAAHHDREAIWWTGNS